MVLMVNGIWTDSKDVSLDVGKSKVVTFQLKEDTAGDYQIDVNGSSGMFTGSGFGPSRLRLSPARLQLLPRLASLLEPQSVETPAGRHRCAAHSHSNADSIYHRSFKYRQSHNKNPITVDHCRDSDLDRTSHWHGRKQAAKMT